MWHSRVISRKSATCSTCCGRPVVTSKHGSRTAPLSMCAAMPTRWPKMCMPPCNVFLASTARTVSPRSMRCAAKEGTCAMSTDVRPPSANERIKSDSRFLRGTIADGLTHAETGSLADDDQQLTKFHGIYLQDDRDLRPERGRQKMEKAFIFMARLRVPGGVLTPKQWLAAERMARERGNGTLRFTTRQTIQFHGIIKSNLRPLIQGLHTEMLDTIAACGDVNRNVVASVDPWRRAGHAEVSKLAADIGTYLLPRSRAWHEIWIGEERVAGGVEEDEPIYGRTYMPRKFKIGVALP